MNVAVFAYSRQGCKTAKQVMTLYAHEQCRAYTMQRFEQPGFLPITKPSHELYAENFAWADLMVFVGSCGIAVREIAPYVKDKKTDPAVLVTDELGKFVIPLLSGHIGGANEFAQILAKLLKATPVITTATDINHKFSVDAWAARKGFVISSMAAAKAVSAAILEEYVPLCCDFPIVSPLPNGVVDGKSGKVGICMSYEQKTPYAQTLNLIPKIVHLGIGCRRNTPVENIREVVNGALQAANIDRRAVKCVASIDLKADEQGLLAFCEENSWEIAFYTAEQLKEVNGDFTPSEFVKSITGVDNVCERAALKDADKLIIKKTACNGVTVAAAVEYLEVNFG